METPLPFTRIAVLALVVACALTLRWHGQRDEVLYPDAAVYMRQAVGYLAGEPSIAPPWRGLPAGGPVYPALTALVTPLAGDVERAGTWVSRAAGGVALPALTAWLGFQLGGPVAGLLAGLLTAVEPRLVHFSESNLSETLFMALLVGALLWARRIQQRDGPWGEDLALGALLGLIALTRAIGIVGAPAVVAVLALSAPTGQPWGRRLARAARVAVGAVLVLGLYQGPAWSLGWTTAFDTHTPAALVAPASPEPATEAPARVQKPARATHHGGPRVVGNAIKHQVDVLGRMLPAPLWALALLGLGARMLRFRERSPAPELLLLGVAGAYLLGLSLFGTSLARYLVVVFPIVFLYAGLGLGALGSGAMRVARSVAPGPSWLAPGVVAALMVVAGAVVTEQVRAAFVVPDRSYAEVRELAREVREAAPLASPLAVFADHAFFPYYMGGYWRGPAVDPARLTRLGDGNRVVLLDSSHAGRWPAAWAAAALERRDAEGFRLYRQRYYPHHGQLLTVYVDAAPAEPAGDDGPALLRQGRLAQAARAFERNAPPAVARRGLGVIEMVVGQFFPQRLTRAREYLRPDGADTPVRDSAPDRDRTRWRWSLPPGEVMVATDTAAAAWNRAAVALALGETDAAAQALPTLARAFPADPRARYLEGLVALQTGHATAALPLLEKARRGLPDDPGVAVAWANTLATLHQLDRAIPVYREVLEREPKNAGVWLNLTQAQLQAGDIEAAGTSIARLGRMNLTSAQQTRLDILDRYRRSAVGTAAPGGGRPPG